MNEEGIFVLSNEIIFKIHDFMDVKTQINFAKLCRRFNKIHVTSWILKKRKKYKKLKDKMRKKFMRTVLQKNRCEVINLDNVRCKGIKEDNSRGYGVCRKCEYIGLKLCNNCPKVVKGDFDLCESCRKACALCNKCRCETGGSPICGNCWNEGIPKTCPACDSRVVVEDLFCTNCCEKPECNQCSEKLDDESICNYCFEQSHMK